MRSTYDDVRDKRVYVSATYSDIPAVFFHACATLRQLDRVLKELVREEDPETPEACELEQWVDQLYAEADDLIATFRRQMNDSHDHLVALQALIVGFKDPEGDRCEALITAGLTSGIEGWLRRTPDTELRREVEYLANRPHVLNIIVSRTESELEPRSALSP